MCDPVPNEPANPFDDEPVWVFVDPRKALPPTGAKQPDPGLQTDLWELNKPAQAARRLSKARFGFDLDPKDVVVEVKHTGHLVKVKLSHKPTGFSCEEGGVGDQKEAIHSRLWGKLKGIVQKEQELDARHLEGRVAMPAPTDDEALVMEAFDFGQFSHDMLGPVLTGGVARGLTEPVRVALCNVLEKMHDRLYGKGMAIAAEVKPSSLVPVPIHLGLHPATRSLVASFAEAMAEKLYSAQQKYGYSDGWADPDFIHECRTHLREHLEKGDPRDVANYCAFLWWHNASTVQTELLAAEARTVPEPKASIPEAIEHSWKAYQLGQVSADHTAKQVFVGVMEKFAEWLVEAENWMEYKAENLAPCPCCGAHLPQMKTSGKRRYTIKCTECPVRGEFFSSTAEQAVAAWNRRPPQPSSQIHPDSALPSRRSE